MPNTKSAAKAMRQAVRRKAANQKTKDKFRTATKTVKKFIESGAAEDALKALQSAMSTLDKAAKKGVIKKGTASRRKSRLAKAIARIAKK